jgi:hypothetical protein
MTAKRTRRIAWAVICLFIVTIALAALVLWILPVFLTQHPSNGTTAAERLKATNDVRAPLVAFMVAIGAVGTLWFTARTYALNREGHVTDRYSKALGQLGDNVSWVRIGGVYALERIGKDSPNERSSIIYVLGAFIRERSKELRDRPDVPPQDVKAGLQVVARLLAISNATLDLRDAYLSHTDLSGLPKERTLLEGADLQDAKKPSM